MEDLTKMLGHMQEAQAKVQEIQQRLAHIKATGEAGAGAVKATVNGHKRVLTLDIDKDFICPEEKEVLQDLIIAAITLATHAVEDKVQEEVKQNASGILRDLPVDFML